MKISLKTKLSLLLLALLFLASCSESVDFYLVDGTPHRMSEYRGKWLIINFWAEWCAPCREEVPALNKLLENSDRNELAIIGVSFDPLTDQELIEIMVKWDMKYPSMSAEPSPILSFNLPKGLPGNYLFNPKGKLVVKLSGQQTFESLSKLLNSLKIKEK